MENPATADIINHLPNEVLRHILSFLPIELAFATSAVSKRWAPLCHSLIVPRFDDEAVKDRDSFNRLYRFVDTFMLSPHVQHLPIKTFHLKCSSCYWYSHYFKINKWIEIAKRRGLEDLDLSMSDNIKGLELTPNIFNSPTLVVLKLSKLHVKGNISWVILPLLKTLHLDNVVLQNSEDLKRLINGCPLLEDLHTDMYYEETGCVRPQGFQTLSKLVRADINSFDVPFRTISNVELLRIVKYRERHNDAETNSYYNALPVFRNLIHLEIEFYEFRHGWDDILELLQHCPKLQVLSIIKAWGLNKNLYLNWKYSNSVPECVGSHLRSCTITSSCFLGDDLRFATYILQNAQLVQALTIDSCESLNSIQKHQFSNELSSCSKISPECELSLKFSS